jgi:methyl-accepting chemotaxis protein
VGKVTSARTRLWRAILPVDGRRHAWHALSNPRHQLVLPVQILALTAVLTTTIFAYGRMAYEPVLALMLEQSEGAAAFELLLREQTRDFALVSGALVIGFALITVALCVRSTQRLLGPQVPLRRLVQALRAGDASARVHLREGDAFGDLAVDLNGLAEDLQEKERGPGPVLPA